MHFHYPAAFAALVVAAQIAALDAENPNVAETTFKKAVIDSVEKRWHASMEANHKELVPGTVRIHIAIAPVRKIVDLRVISNTSNRLAAQLTMNVIRRAQIPPVPPELLVGGVYQDDWDFKIYAQ